MTCQQAVLSQLVRASDDDTAGAVVVQLFGRFGEGGAGNAALNLARGLAGCGVRSIVAAVRASGSEPAARVDLESFDAGVRGGRDLPAAALRFRRFIRDRKVSVLHVHGESALVFAMIALVGMRRRPSVCFTWHNPEPMRNRTFKRNQYPTLLCLKFCQNIYAPSQQVADGVSTHFLVRRAVTVLRNGVPPGPESQAVGDEVPTIVWAARFNPTKHPRMLIRVAGRLHAEGVRFKIIMAGASPTGMQGFYDDSVEMANDLGLSEVIEFPGWIDAGDELPLRGSIGVQTSLTEGLSLTLLEQMMAGLAVVATEVGDTAEVVADEVTGFLIEPDNEEQLHDALRRLVSDPGLRQAVGTRARELACRELSSEAMARRILHDYGLERTDQVGCR